MSEPIDHRALLLSFIGSLCLADHMGDAADATVEVLKRMDIRIEWDDWNELRAKLGKMGITTLYGTSLVSEDDA